MDLVIEQLLMKFLKFSTIIGAWIFAQASEYADGIIGKGFDQLFSIGLLLAFLVTLWKEYKANQKLLNQRSMDAATKEADILKQIREVLNEIKDNQKNGD